MTACINMGMYWFLSCPTWIARYRTISNSFRTSLVYWSSSHPSVCHSLYRYIIISFPLNNLRTNWHNKPQFAYALAVTRWDGIVTRHFPNICRRFMTLDLCQSFVANFVSAQYLEKKNNNRNLPNFVCALALTYLDCYL